MFELSEFQIFVNNWSQTTLNIAIQLVSHSVWQLFFEAKKLSHIKSVNEMNGKDIWIFSGDSDHSLLA